MPRHDAIGFVLGLLSICGLMIDPAMAGCAIEGTGSETQGPFKMHLPSNCTEAEREAHAIDADTIMLAMKQSRAIDLSGVVIRGDLRFDSLPLSERVPSVESLPSQPNGENRLVAGGLSIVNSIVRGAMTHRSGQGTLYFVGPVTFAGTTFEQPVDLSRSVFLQDLTLSGAVFLRESYFGQGHFLKTVVGEKTAFGPHTRFHRSRFHGPVTFLQSGFSGLSEFLEVQFDRDANFSRTYFKLGTGFSGSQFTGLADFSESLFDGDAFFTFTRFDGDAYFRRATFRATADFDDAQFNAREDFSKTFFEKGPQFTRAKRSAQSPQALGMENPQVQYAITLSLLLFSAVLIAYLVRSK